MSNGNNGWVWGMCSLSLTVGQTIVFGTANMGGAQQNGPTYLWLIWQNPATGVTTVVSQGSSYPLQWSATAAMNGQFTLMEGCTGNAYYYSCSGTVGYQIYTAAPTPPAVAVTTSTAFSSSVGTCQPFSGASRVVATCQVNAFAGSTLVLGTTRVGGSACNGDTYLTLQSPSGAVLTSNDDANGGACSYISYSVPTTGTYTVQEGCYSSSSCGGTVGYQVQGLTTASPAVVVSAVVASQPPPPAVVVSTSRSGTCSPYSGGGRVVTTCQISATAGSSLMLGTTLVSGSACSGDTYLTLQSPSGAVLTSSDDANGGLCSYISYIAPITGTYTVQEGCYSSGQCGGTVSYQVR
jgi:hypothetical protein